MKLLKLVTICLALALFLNFCAGAKKSQTEGTVTISGILREAKCPLSGEQEKKLKELTVGGDRSAFREVSAIFDEKQTGELKKVFGSSPGRDGGPEMPRFLFFAILFENEQCPLSAEQLKLLNALPDGREGFQKMGDVLTEKQNGILQGMFNR